MIIIKRGPAASARQALFCVLFRSAIWGMRIAAPVCALARNDGVEGVQGLLLVQLEHGHKRLGRNLYRSQRAHLLLARPTKGRPFAGTPFYLTCSGGVNPPCAKVLASGQNACTAHSAAPRCGAPEGNKKMLPVYSSSSLSTAMKASVGICTVPRLRIFFLPSFCFSSSFFLRVMSPP